MGKASAAEQKREMRERLTKERFLHHLSKANAAKAACDEANMENAGVHKAAQSAGLHPAVFKIAMRLSRMEHAALSDWLRAFDQYRAWLDLDRQPDMFAGAEDEQHVDDGGWPDDEVLPEDEDEEDERIPGNRNENAQEDEEADLPAVASDELLNGGYASQAGNAAAMSGMSVQDNPYELTNPLHIIWQRGFIQGITDAAEAASGGAVEPAPAEKPKRSRRKAPGEEALAAARSHLSDEPPAPVPAGDFEGLEFSGAFH